MLQTLTKQQYLTKKKTLSPYFSYFQKSQHSQKFQKLDKVNCKAREGALGYKERGDNKLQYEPYKYTVNVGAKKSTKLFTTPHYRCKSLLSSKAKFLASSAYVKYSPSLCSLFILLKSISKNIVVTLFIF